jgi:hypothetical protein
MIYLSAFLYEGSLKIEGMDIKLFRSLLSINLFIYGIILIRFLVIKYLIEIFLSSNIKFIFFKNYIINIIIGILMLINFTFYNLNSFYNIDYLKNMFLILIGLHFIFQAKNYFSLIIKFELKEVMYFILYLCAFKLAPWIWLYQDVSK